MSGDNVTVTWDKLSLLDNSLHSFLIKLLRLLLNMNMDGGWLLAWCHHYVLSLVGMRAPMITEQVVSMAPDWQALIQQQHWTVDTAALLRRAQPRQPSQPRSTREIVSLLPSLSSHMRK